MTIATDFHHLCSNELWEELLWLEDQPITKDNAALYDRLLNEIRVRNRRRQYLIDHWD